MVARCACLILLIFTFCIVILHFEICILPFPLASSFKNEPRWACVFSARFDSARNLTPRGPRRRSPKLGSPLAAAVGVIPGIHGGSANAGAHSHFAVPPGFADSHQTMLRIWDCSDRRHTNRRYQAHLAGRKRQGSVRSFLRHNNSTGSSRTNKNRAPAALELNVINYRTYRNPRKLRPIPDLDRRFQRSSACDARM